MKVLPLLCILIFTSFSCVTGRTRDGSVRISKFAISLPVSGEYGPWRDNSDTGRFYGGQIITIEGSSFRYRTFSDVFDPDYPTPNYSGKIIVFEDHIFLDHPGVPFPYRISGVADGMPVLMEWEAYERWKKTGKVFPGEILYLQKEKQKPTTPNQPKYKR